MAPFNTIFGFKFVDDPDLPLLIGSVSKDVFVPLHHVGLWEAKPIPRAVPVYAGPELAAALLKSGHYFLCLSCTPGKHVNIMKTSTTHPCYYAEAQNPAQVVPYRWEKPVFDPRLHRVHIRATTVPLYGFLVVREGDTELQNWRYYYKTADQFENERFVPYTLGGVLVESAQQIAGRELAKGLLIPTAK